MTFYLLILFRANDVKVSSIMEPENINREILEYEVFVETETATNKLI